MPRVCNSPHNHPKWIANAHKNATCGRLLESVLPEYRECESYPPNWYLPYKTYFTIVFHIQRTIERQQGLPSAPSHLWCRASGCGAGVTCHSRLLGGADLGVPVGLLRYQRMDDLSPEVPSSQLWQLVDLANTLFPIFLCIPVWLHVYIPKMNPASTGQSPCQC
jgi:hypothetical protein